MKRSTRSISGCNEVAGGFFRNVGHPQWWNPHRSHSTGSFNLEDAIRRRAAFAAGQREDVAAGEDDGKAVHPFANGAVLERGRTGRARGHRAAGECTEVGGHRRKPSADLQQRVLHLLQRDSGADANAISIDRHRAQPFGRKYNITGRAWRRRSTTIARRPASTRSKSRKHADTSSVERGRTTPLASPPAKCAASSRNRAISAGSRSSSSDSADGGLALARDRTTHIVPLFQSAQRDDESRDKL